MYDQIIYVFLPEANDLIPDEDRPSKLHFYFNFDIREVSEVNDKTQTLSIPMYFSVQWREARLWINESAEAWNQNITGPKGVRRHARGTKVKVWKSFFSFACFALHHMTLEVGKQESKTKNKLPLCNKSCWSNGRFTNYLAYLILSLRNLKRVSAQKNANSQAERPK